MSFRPQENTFFAIFWKSCRFQKLRKSDPDLRAIWNFVLRLHPSLKLLGKLWRCPGTAQKRYFFKNVYNFCYSIFGLPVRTYLRSEFYPSNSNLKCFIEELGICLGETWRHQYNPTVCRSQRFSHIIMKYYSRVSLEFHRERRMREVKVELHW